MLRLPHIRLALREHLTSIAANDAIGVTVPADRDAAPICRNRLVAYVDAPFSRAPRRAPGSESRRPSVWNLPWILAVVQSRRPDSR